MKTLKKTFNFGKIDYNHSGRKNCSVDVDVELRYKDNGNIELSICGDIWNPRHTDCYCCGQCLDTIAKYVHNTTFKKLYRYWQLYHLNSMHAGTPEQEQALEDWHRSKERENAIIFYDYKIDCEYLKTIGLYTVEYEGKPYTYGTRWLYYAIPADDLKDIESLLV